MTMTTTELQLEAQIAHYESRAALAAELHDLAQADRWRRYADDARRRLVQLQATNERQAAWPL